MPRFFLLLVVSLSFSLVTTPPADAHDGSHSRGSTTRSPNSSPPVTKRRSAAPLRTRAPSGMLTTPARRTLAPTSTSFGRRPTFGSPLPNPRFSGVAPTTSFPRRTRRSKSRRGPQSITANKYDSGATAGLRHWTDNSGRYSIRAKLAHHTDSTVWLRKKSGELVRLRIEQLSEADQTHVLNMSSAKETTVVEPNATLRRWTDQTGSFSTSAELIHRNRDMVWLRKEDGGLAKVPLASLSPTDQAFVNRSER